MTNLHPGGQQSPRGLTAMGAPAPQQAPSVAPATASAGVQTVAAAAAESKPAPAPGPVTGRNTPRLLVRLRAAVIVTSLLFAVLCVIGTTMPYGALTGARQDIEQGQRLRSAQASLARAQALAAEAADPKVNGDAAAFRKETDALSASLVAAAAAIPSDSAALATAAGQVSAFRAAVDLGLAQKTSTDATKAQAAVSTANDAVGASAGTTLRDLTANADSRLPARFSTTAAPLVVGGAIVALAAALVAATLVGLRTRRFINLGLTGAVIALLIAMGLAIGSATTVTGGADVAESRNLSSARAAADVRVLVEQARTAQLSGTTGGQSWAQVATKVRESLATISATDTSTAADNATTAWGQAEAAQAKADLPATRTAIDKVTAAVTPLEATSTAAATDAVGFERVLVYGITAAILAVVAALLAAFGITTRLNEYR